MRLSSATSAPSRIGACSSFIVARAGVGVERGELDLDQVAGLDEIADGEVLRVHWMAALFSSPVKRPIAHRRAPCRSPP